MVQSERRWGMISPLGVCCHTPAIQTEVNLVKCIAAHLAEAIGTRLVPRRRGCRSLREQLPDHVPWSEKIVICCSNRKQKAMGSQLYASYKLLPTKRERCGVTSRSGGCPNFGKVAERGSGMDPAPAPPPAKSRTSDRSWRYEYTIHRKVLGQSWIRASQR